MKKHHFYFLFAALALITTGSIPSFAQQNGVVEESLTYVNKNSPGLESQGLSNTGKTTLSIETDPSTFTLKGYAFHLRLKPKNSRHWLVGAGTYALDMPDILVDMNPENKDKGWNVRINSAYSLFGEYYFKEANSQWFVGLQAGVQNFKNTNDHLAHQERKYSNLLLMPSIGYNWQPFRFPFYIKPWAGLGYTKKVSGDNSIDELTYQISPLIPFVTFHLGYTL